LNCGCTLQVCRLHLHPLVLSVILQELSYPACSAFQTSSVFCSQHIAVNALARMPGPVLFCQMSLQGEIAVPAKRLLKGIPPSCSFTSYKAVAPCTSPTLWFLSARSPGICCSQYSPDSSTTQNAIQKSCLHFIIFKLPKNSIPARSSR